ncbi:uncharacterized protein LOC142615551 [Castanea sativa]|uniref:uncharacterized protein LOC142615551 n=1 Tax=Castanea sativa TaxID=21020 RepID=UPI003F652C22
MLQLFEPYNKDTNAQSGHLIEEIHMLVQGIRLSGFVYVVNGVSNINLLAHNEDGLPPLQIWEMARSVVEDYQEAISVNLLAYQQPNRGWEAPPPGFFKVNVFGASSLDGLGTSGVGVIIHDDSGSVIAALSKALPLQYPAAWTELFAMEQGVLLAQEMTLSKVIFESDAISVIQAISQDLFGSETGHLVQGIQLAKSSFLRCSFRHVKRDCNRAAHELAQLAKNSHASNVWKGVTPPFLVHLIQSGLG